jgi:hypothetical protein
VNHDAVAHIQADVVGLAASESPVEEEIARLKFIE